MNFFVSLWHFEKCCAIHFWEFLVLSGLGRPFHRKGVAVHLGGIAIALKGPRHYDLSAFIFHAA
jgi:hypothetical protein